MKKRILSLLLAAAMLISVVPLSASAAEVVSIEVQDMTSEAYLSYLELDKETRSSLQPPLAVSPPTVDILEKVFSIYHLKNVSQIGTHSFIKIKTI